MAGPDNEAAVLRIGAAIEDLARLYPWLDSEATAHNVPDATRQRMHVALEEAVANIAMHAYGSEAGEGEITIRLLASPAAAALVVEDDGPPFNPIVVPTRERAASLADIEPGGLGLTLLRHFCPDIGYERVDHRNRLTLRFPLAQAATQ